MRCPITTKVLNITLAKEIYQIHTWSMGTNTKPTLLLLHGFPTSSTDYLPLAENLQKDFRLVAFDFLGFGRSQKSNLPNLSIRLQAEITQAVLRQYELSNPYLLAHDYGLTVAQELLARGESFQKIILLNGGAYTHLHRPLLIQKLLRHSILGPIVSRLGNKKIFLRNLTKVLRKPVPVAWLNEAWLDVSFNGGNKIFHRLIHYIGDRELNAERWAQALNTNQDKLIFIWGTLDPISGAHMLAYLQQELPHATFHPLAVGHYPQWEALPETAQIVIEELLA
jgi:pimeloyl-ACP methyl ester carboxylesterase